MQISLIENMRKKVVASDGKPLGVFMNITMTKKRFTCRMVVFPGLNPKLVEEFDNVREKIVEYAANKMENELKDTFGTSLFGDLGDTIENLYDSLTGWSPEMQARTYFKIPVSKIASVEKDCIKLQEDRLTCIHKYKGRSGVRRSEVAFFEKDLVKEWDRPVEMDLMLDSIRGCTLKDEEDDFSEVYDVLLDTESGKSSHFVVELQGERMLDTSNVAFETKNEETIMVSKGKIIESPFYKK